MKAIKKYISAFVMLSVVAVGLSSCSEDEFTETIFPDVSDEIDPSSYTYKFDKWLKINFLDVYNLDFRYKMQDVGTNMNYNLVPASYQNAIDLAVLTKFLWFDVYKKVAGPEFLKQYGPRIIHLIGSPAYNPSTGTMIVGLAEGGIKVSLFRVNEIDKELNNFNALNEYYFKTMHHEFGHILHQTKSYPTRFNTISVGKYDGSNWQDRQEGVVYSLGFASTYGSSAYREDFAEIIANYIVKTDEQWDRIFELAARGWEQGDPDDPDAAYYCWYYYKNNEAGDDNKVYIESDNDVFKEVDESGVEHLYYKNNRDKEGNRIVVYAVEDKDGIDGVQALLDKIQIVREWFRDEFGVDIDALRAEVQYRQVNYNVAELRKEVEDMQ